MKWATFGFALFLSVQTSENMFGMLQYERVKNRDFQSINEGKGVRS